MRTTGYLLNCVRTQSIMVLILTAGLVMDLPAQMLPSENPSKTFTLVIDAGHGGKDPGAVGKRSKEKDIALAIASKTGHYISSLMNDVEVLYTRTNDVYVDLYARADFATRNKADLFMSIHVNGNKSQSIYGAETYVMGPSKSEGNLEIAKKENSVILLEENYDTKYEGFNPNDPASYIMFSLMQNTFLNQSLLMASHVQDQLRVKAKRKDGGVRQGPFLVLWRTTMPSVLIETGYITNQQEEEYLNTAYGQDVIASSIYEAFKKYKEETEARTAVLAENNPGKDPGLGLETEKPATALPVNNSDSAISKTPDTLVKQAEIAPEKTESKVVSADNSLIFRVQVLASERPVPKGSGQLKNETSLEEIQMDGLYKYMSEPITSYSQAQELRKKLSVKFPGSFIVAFLGGKKVPLQEAIKMDGEK